MRESTKEAVNWMGELAIIHTTGVETEGRYCMVELYATKEGNPPWHLHEREDEGFYIIEGVLTLYIGEVVHKAKAGDFVLAPKGVKHKYTVDSRGHARVLLLCTPAGFEDFVRATSTRVDKIKPLTPDEDNSDYEAIKPVAATYGITFMEEE